MQSKYLLTGIAVVVVAGVVFFAVSSSGPTTDLANDEVESSDTASTETKASDTNQSGEFKGTFAELVARTGNYRCTFSFGMSGVNSDGVVYVSDGNLRGDFTSTIAQANTKVESHMIQTGGYMYIWSSLMPTGYKVKISAQTGATVPNQPVSMSDAYQYDCDTWRAESSVFVVPSSVTFTEAK